MTDKVTDKVTDKTDKVTDNVAEDENIQATNRDILLIVLPTPLPLKAWERFEIFFEGDMRRGCNTDPMGNSLFSSPG